MGSRARSSLIALGVLAAAIPAAAVAKDAQVEPSASSPAGAVYEIPLETARRDAAPRRSGNGRGTAVTPATSGGGGGSGGGGVLPQGSAVKSENGYGSSSRVPGEPVAHAGATTAKAASLGALGVSTSEIVKTKPAAAHAQIPSTSSSYLLIALLVLAGAATGVLAGSALRRGFR